MKSTKRKPSHIKRCTSRCLLAGTPACGRHEIDLKFQQKQLYDTSRLAESVFFASLLTSFLPIMYTHFAAFDTNASLTHVRVLLNVVSHAAQWKMVRLNGKWCK